MGVRAIQAKNFTGRLVTAGVLALIFSLDLPQNAGLSGSTADAAVPCIAGSCGGAAAPPPAPAPASRACDPKEDGAWGIARDMKESAGIEDFLRRYPNGCHAKEAKDRIASLRPKAAPAAPAPSVGAARPAAPLAQEPAAPPQPVAEGSAAAPVPAVLAICPVNLPGTDPKWSSDCLGRLAPDVARAVQQAREAEVKAVQQAAAARAAQMRSVAAAAAAQAAERNAKLPAHPAGLVVQDFTAQKLGTYAGQLDSGVRKGDGVWLGVNGERYEGEWSGDLRNGVGKTVPPTGPTFEGTWKDGNPCGVGVLIWPNGDHYEGDYCNGQFSGYGIFYYANTSFARENRGQFANSVQTGFGVRLWAGQNRSEGQWLNGGLNGYAAEFNADGKLQVGVVPQQGLYEGGKLKTPMKR